MNREILQKKYDALLDLLEMNSISNDSNINIYVRQILREFMKKHRRVAIYCYGYHTKMLMTDFISDIRDIVCIVDQNYYGENSGYKIIKETEIECYDIDGVIVSSFKFKNEIEELMSNKHPNIDLLDIYEELKIYGIYMESEYYCSGPYKIYSTINDLNNLLENDLSKRIEYLQILMKQYILIKDFRMAINVSQQILEDTRSKRYEQIIQLLKEIYECQLNAVAETNERNVLLICLDGLRYCDFEKGKLKNMKETLENKGRIFTRGYSYSTMTFESLIPAFSENTDQRTKYYHSDSVDIRQCRFGQKALEQNRRVIVYGDGNEYIAGECVEHIGNPQTISEKLWDLSLDMCESGISLFYLHELYESHYSFPNPYTTGKMISTGTAMLFDFLPKNGGKLRTDYSKQLDCSLKYIDETLTPFIDKLTCSVFIFSDHGNLLLNCEDNINKVSELQFSAAEEWIRIPFIIISKNVDNGEDNSLVSLLDLNDIVISLLDNCQISVKRNRAYIKIGRSEIYNPDFKEVYRMANFEYDGEAFEGFVFEDGYKLLVYANKNVRIYNRYDELMDDENLLKKRYERIKDEITIY